MMVEVPQPNLRLAASDTLGDQVLDEDLGDFVPARNTVLLSNSTVLLIARRQRSGLAVFARKRFRMW